VYIRVIMLSSQTLSLYVGLMPPSRRHLRPSVISPWWVELSQFTYTACITEVLNFASYIKLKMVRLIGKGQHLLAGCSKERPIISQPQYGRCHRAGTEQTTLEVIGSKRSYTLNWCKPNNDDDDDDWHFYLCLNSK